MIELVVIGILVSISVFSLGMSVDFVRFGSDMKPVADAGGLDIDLSGCEHKPAECASEDRRSNFQPKPLGEADLKELTRQVQALDVSQVDYDLTAMAESRPLH
jgi:hypothetical protein